MDWFINNKIVVEYFGLNSESYNAKTKNKILLCKENNIPIISLFQKDISNLNNIFNFLVQ